MNRWANFTGWLAAAATLSACSTLKSLPFSTSYDLLDSEAVRVAQLAPPITVNNKEELWRDGAIVGLGISGGGMRASSFALGVLAGLDQIQGPAGRSVLKMTDFASSNSGGSWALAAYLADRKGAPGYDLKSRFDHLSYKFGTAASRGVKCWAENLHKEVTGGARLGEYRDQRPRPYFNATLLPGHSPFVFTEEFVDAYKVRQFHSRCDELNLSPNMRLTDLPLGYVAASSGSVPGFTHSYAETGWCERRPAPSFCGRSERGRRDFVRIVDGGLYDNLGYKTAWEVARALSGDQRQGSRVVFLIDSKDGWTIPLMTAKKAKQHDGLLKSAWKLGRAASFPLQNATFLRLAGPMFHSIGFESAVLDFESTNGFRKNSAAMVVDLPNLLAMAADEIDCLDEHGQVLRHTAKQRPPGIDPLTWLESRGGDCLANNFARVGYHHKTTYLYDAVYFAATYELGLLAVRMREKEIRAAMGWD